MNTPRISIIMPTYNRGYLIWKTIQSLQAQTFKDWELVIVDDGSKDATKDTVAQFSDDARIKYFPKANGGGSSARNYGLTKVKAELVAYVDSDDPVGPKFLETAVNVFDEDDQCKFAVCNHIKAVELYDNNQKLIAALPETPAASSTINLTELYQWKFKTSGTGIFHRMPIEPSIQWNSNMKLIEDFEFILQLAGAYPEGFRFIAEPLFTYAQRYGGDGVCSNASYLDFSKAFGQIYELHKDDKYMTAEVFTNRVTQYQTLHEQVARGEIPPPHLKYFPNAHR